MHPLKTLAAAAALGAAALLLPMCLPPPDGCTPLATRCNGERAEICDGATRWSLVMDCAEVAAQSGGDWVCCALGPADAGASAEHTCLPPTECSGGTP
jgi:hypothetical protein